MKLVGVLLAIALTVIADPETNGTSPYCGSHLCPLGKKHVSCENNPNDFYESCSSDKAKIVKINEYVGTILYQHNQRRTRVAGAKNNFLPPAARMMVMRWSDELASMAAFNVRSCLARHDECRNTFNYPRSGQNVIVFNMSKMPNELPLDKVYGELIGVAAKTWWGEHDLMPQHNIEQFSCENEEHQKYRHFAVMALESNSHVGCAAMQFKDARGITYFKLTCNYAKDYECNKPIYHIHSKGCTTGMNRKHNYLCSKKEKFN